MAKNDTKRADQIVRMIERADIVEVAQKLGLQIDGRRREPRLAICPFHTDKDPSLNLYRGGKGRAHRGHYHCFACGVHGDAIDLIRNYEHTSFPEAVLRLAQLLGEQLDPTQDTKFQTKIGARRFRDVVANQSPFERKFSDYASHRGFDPLWLRQAGTAVLSLNSLLQTARTDRVLEEELIEGGIARRRTDMGGTGDLWSGELQGFFWGERLVFQINNDRGDVVGFAARTIADEKPKFLYSYGFARRETLYRADVVFERLAEERRQKELGAADIYIVEGLFDALRMEALGLKSVAVLGAKIVAEQFLVLSSILSRITQEGRVGRVHIFFDRDEAGRRGAYDLILELLKHLNDAEPFSIDVIWPVTTEEGIIDPDGYLRGVDKNEAQQTLQSASISVFRFLAAYRLQVDPAQLQWSTIPRLHIASEARRIARGLIGVSWAKILAPFDAEFAEDPPLAEFVELIRLYGSPELSQISRVGVTQVLRDQADTRSDLLSALTLGRSSTSRREYPLDDGSWDRLATAASTFYHLHKARLEIGDSPSSPLLTREIPKGDGRYRLKSGPVAEDAILQQYILLELLRDRLDCPHFADLIPAVRYSSERDEVYCSGMIRSPEAVSFAYQIDMSVVNGGTPARREGVFRPYFECWRSFVDFLEAKVKAFHHNEVQILRLDIKGFYDHIRLDVVEECLMRPLAAAMGVLTASQNDIGSFAPLLLPEKVASPEDRAEAITDFIIRHTFGLKRFDPKDGSVKDAEARKGIPQGPDLSAYLANISLFKLDEMMTREVGFINESISASGRCGAAYARYVDDIVLICNDIETASQLRRKIESHLAVLGLSLNRKNATPPRMSRAEARAWITNNRSGFGFSGPISELPTIDSLDPLAEAGEIDRKTALGLLFDPELDDPDNFEAGLDRIALALSAPDLRFNDCANAYRRLWIYAARNDYSNGDPANLASAFVSLLQRVNDRAFSNTDPHERHDLALASLEGLDRALRLKVPSGALTPEVCEKINELIRRIGVAVLNDVFQPLMEVLELGSQSEDILGRYDVRTQIGIMVLLAAQYCHQATSGVDTDIDKVERYLVAEPQLESGLRWSLHLANRTIRGAYSQLLVTRTNASGVVFKHMHAAIVQLQRLSRSGSVDDELLSLSDEGLAEPNKLVRMTATILQLWRPGNNDNDLHQSDEQVELDAASTLVNLTYVKFAEIASRRPRLIKLIANETEATALPSPPGLRSEGILLWCPNNRLLLASPENSDAKPVGVTWLLNENQRVPGVNLYSADLPANIQPLHSVKIDWTPAHIAQAYRKFFGIWYDLHRADLTIIPIPTVFSFFGRYDKTGGFKDCAMICWVASQATVDGHSFVRVGDTLEARSVHLRDAEYWRFGWSIRDLCERTESPIEQDGGLDAHAGVSLEEDYHRRDALVYRVLPRISGADQFGAGRPHQLTGIPTRIERGVRLLEKFGEGSIGRDAAYLISAITEGMFMSERMSIPTSVTSSGVAATLLVNASRRAMRAIPQAAPYLEISDLEVGPYRRSALAWFSVAARLRKQANLLTEDQRLPLNVLVAGGELLGIISDLRALAFELAAGLQVESVERLTKSKIDSGWIKEISGLDLYLVELHPVADLAFETQVQILTRTFFEIVRGKVSALNQRRDSITPSGWVVIVSILLQISLVSDETELMRPALWPMQETQVAEAKAALAKLLAYVSTSPDVLDEGDAWPWDAFETLLQQKPNDPAALLRAITDAASILVVTERTSVNPRSADERLGKAKFNISGGSTVSLADWQVDVAYVRGEKGSSTEVYEVDGRHRYIYSLAKTGDRILGIHLVSRQLGETAFGKISSPEGKPSATANKPKEEEPKAARMAPRDGAEKKGPPGTLLYKNDDASDGLLERLRLKQRKSWEKRGDEKSIGIHRVALVQWDVTDTYFSPSNKGGEAEGLVGDDGAPVPPGDLKGGGNYLSTTEYRRRAILRAVLSACADFKVDGVVLPEYSLRPETINWLARQLKALAQPITIWCGTFRVPGGTQIGRNFSPGAPPFVTTNVSPLPSGVVPFDFHSSLLTYLRFAEVKDGAIIESGVRPKRYPSVAAGELIRPSNEPWQPQLADVSDAFELGAYTIELICSEVFPHASSANYIGVIEETEVLAKNYGLSLTMDLFKSLARDIYQFAKWTSYRNVASVTGDSEKHLWRGKSLQRTLVIVPSMTTRSADFHIFGQNQYLAAGLVTAFCNAVSQFGCGQSCFIGRGAWKEVTTPSPYGKVAPGIFQLDRKHIGPLGRAESAMVIADLDLLHTADQAPRPHYQGHTTKLVAHLPFIYHTEPGAGTQGECPNSLRKLRSRGVIGGGTMETFDVAAKYISDALELEQDWRSAKNPLQHGIAPSVQYVAAIDAVAKAMSTLELFADDPVWLIERRKDFLANRYDFPSARPLPALIDWIYIDDRWVAPVVGPLSAESDRPLNSDQPRLEVPALCLEPDWKPH